MSVKIRLARRGAKKYPYYHIIIASSQAPRDGKFIEKIGTYNPNLNDTDQNRVVINSDRALYWLKNGACPTERVEKFLNKLNISLN